MLLEQVKNFYQTHSKDEIDKIWKDIIDEKHSGPTVTEYLNYLTVVELSDDVEEETPASEGEAAA
jgi:predicted ribonuclease toxin of YeeF-YezG toxin-antitoxin module